jgi:hypothetical protein
MVRSSEEKAARKAARSAATARSHERRNEAANREREAQAAARFNARSTRASVSHSLTTQALTKDEHKVAEDRRLVGPVPEPLPIVPFDLLAAREWAGDQQLTEWPERKVLTHGDGWPEPYQPTPSELAARHRQDVLFAERDEGLDDFLSDWLNHGDGHWADPHGIDRALWDDERLDDWLTGDPDGWGDLYDSKFRIFVGYDVECDDRPEWERPDCRQPGWDQYPEIE